VDLVLRDIGIIECRSVLLEDTRLDIPLEAIGDRLGYVVVKIIILPSYLFINLLSQKRR